VRSRLEKVIVIVNWTDILDSEIANALWALAQKLAKPRVSRAVSADLDMVSWGDTNRLIRDTLRSIRQEQLGIPDIETAVLEVALKRHEVQGALQVLLAVRLTDAPESDIAKARQAVRLALGGAKKLDIGRRRQATTANAAAEARLAEMLSRYFDDRVSALVARLEGQVGFAQLAQVRAEAYNRRIVALLGTLVALVETLGDPERYGQNEEEFLERYRRQARERHGKIEPPDFERRRRVAIPDIFVPTTLVRDYPEWAPRAEYLSEPPSLRFWDLIDLIDRTVLLGNPGGGKTTAANVLVDHFASEATHKVPFLVTLREYASTVGLTWSVSEHIEHNLKTLYQLTELPVGLVEHLLLTGRAIVVFDGLDELLDTSRRRNVSERVEQFCAAYPLAPVLVTSRIVGYDQARLDDTQFTCYRLDGFREFDVRAYAHKWFAVQEDISPDEAEATSRAFLNESATAADIRSNPLLLALMCILYRGEGSLPRDKAGIYARCADLLFNKWDEQRRIHRNLRAADFVEPSIQHLAWWLYINENSRAAVTERELIINAADFLHERAFESKPSARSAAKEFIDFCHNRMWVFSDTGTTATGEKLYSFTHRTFLEYFAAAHIATISDSPEDLAHMLAPRLATGQWDVVGELAIQVKDHNSDRGADRIYGALLNLTLDEDDQVQLLGFLSGCLGSTRLSPATIRSLTRAAINCTGSSNQGLHPLSSALKYGSNYRQIIVDEIAIRIIKLALQAPNKAGNSLHDFRMVGIFLQSSRKLPLIRRSRHQPMPRLDSLTALAESSRKYDNDAVLGIATVIAIAHELSDRPRALSICELVKAGEHRELFRSWAKNKVNFVEFPAQ
jgi:hypothetical protein